MKSILRLIFLVGAVALHPAQALAQAPAPAPVEPYPNRPIHLIVPFPPGGSVDVVARLIGPKLAESLGQPVVIENRSGAGGNIATEQVARAKNDGYTLLIHTIPFVANAHLYARVPYDALTDFLPVSLLSASPSLVVVHPSQPMRSVGDLLQQAKARPGALNYAGSGTGTNPHIAGELFNLLGGVDITVIQFKGGGPALLALVGGEPGIGFPNISEAMPFVTAGRLRALAVTGAKRSAALPNLPTLAEAGVPGYEFTTWHGVLAPKGTPKEVISLVNEKLKQLLRSPELIQKFAQLGLDIVASSPDEFGAHLKGESEKWGRVIKERRIRAD
jgi:tripartite-type tricarboxylate transporter receptor subunit TctC